MDDFISVAKNYPEDEDAGFYVKAANSALARHWNKWFEYSPERRRRRYWLLQLMTRHFNEVKLPPKTAVVSPSRD